MVSQIDSNLDEGTVKKISEYIESLASGQGIQMFSVSHRYGVLGPPFQVCPMRVGGAPECRMEAYIQARFLVGVYMCDKTSVCVVLDQTD